MSHDAVSATLSLASERTLSLAEWMREIERCADANTCFLFITLLAVRAADVRGRAIKDTLPPESPTSSWSDLINDTQMSIQNIT
jgi:hypothetical protein